MNTIGWDFPTLAYVWEHRNGAIVAGGERLDALSGDDRQRCLTALHERVLSMVTQLDDGWLTTTAYWMLEDLYKSFFREFDWTPGVRDYISATAIPVVAELSRRGYALHYVIDSTQSDELLAPILAYLPAVFEAAGLLVVGPQLVAFDLFEQTEGHPPTELVEIQRYRQQGHALADEVIRAWHQEGRSSAYLNLDRDDDTPGLDLSAALSAVETPGAILVFHNTPPAEGSTATCVPPAGMKMPPGVPERPAH
ncbi:MAG: hypothetical protein ACR2JM_13520 [Mycobacterium sp.]